MNFAVLPVTILPSACSTWRKQEQIEFDQGCRPYFGRPSRRRRYARCPEYVRPMRQQHPVPSMKNSSVIYWDSSGKTGSFPWHRPFLTGEVMSSSRASMISFNCKEPRVILTEVLAHLRALMLCQAAPESDTLSAYSDSMDELRKTSSVGSAGSYFSSRRRFAAGFVDGENLAGSAHCR